MLVRNTINESNHELYDILLYYLIDKNDYSPRVKKALLRLYNVLIDEINAEDLHGEMDLLEIKVFEIEHSESGKTNEMEINWECYLLNDLVESYFENKRGCYPSTISDLLDKLHKELLNHVIKSGDFMKEDSELIEIMMEYNYEETT